VGLEKTGRIVTGAAAVLFLVTGSFVISEVLLLKALGVGIALAVLLDTTVVRALLVPATMRVLGQWNWWAPRWLRGKARPPLYPPPTPA
jgi:RND superfamily putative drug exporter